jgi:hypothetical protein
MGLCGVNRGVLSLLLAFDILVSVLVASAFAPTPSSTLSKRKLVDPNQEPRHSLSSGQEPEPDLFDYFDPLLSPHAYPDGISPGTKPIMDMKESNKVADKIDSFTRENRPALAEEPSLSSGQEPEPDLFDYFDPLLSPHAYPDGISPGTKPIMDMKESNKGTDKIDSFARENRPALAEEPEYNQELSSSGNSKPSGRGKIGVLLMDHGSRNEASNSRLQHLAKLYQLSLEEENIIVQHCHMEIASPSIAEGLEMLMNQGVGTCR